MHHKQPARSLERYISLLKKGNAASLKKLRILLDVDSPELARKIGITERKLDSWETEAQLPTGLQRAKWKIKLASYVDEKIATVLNTQNNEISSSFWSLIWELAD